MSNKKVLGIAILTGALWLPAGAASLAMPASHGASAVPDAANVIDVLDEVAARGGRGSGARGGGGGMAGGGGMVGGGGMQGGGGQQFAKAGGGMASAGMGGMGKQVAGGGGTGAGKGGKAGGMGKGIAGQGGTAGGKGIAKKGGAVGGGTVGVGPGSRPVRPWISRPYYGTIVGGVALGSIIAATAYGMAPTAPADGLCWFWANQELTQGYWDYCTSPPAVGP
jgi:hypothetical protein